ncbi:MAG: M15 family metallopeptidase [Erysipelotrichaceae bacterium]
MKTKLKKRNCIILVILILSLCGVGIFFYQKYTIKKSHDAMKIVFIKEAIIEYGDKHYDVKKLVKNATDKIVSYPKVDTNKIGKQELKFVIEKDKYKKNIKFNVEVKDTMKPIIKLKEETMSLYLNCEFDPKTNIESISDPVDGELVLSEKEKKNAYTIKSEVDVNTEGNYKVSINAIDQHRNSEHKEYTVEIKKEEVKPVQAAPIVTQTNNGNQPTYVNGILLVNKNHPIPANFGGGNAIASAALTNLQNGAGSTGFSMPLCSGYRSYNTQRWLYNNYVAQYGQASADTFSARPGTSEHQTGLAFDVGAIDDNYGNTPAGIWLAQNCQKYGFIIRYLSGKEGITGYKYEPWHIRYVGVDVATAIMSQGITLEEYLGTN